MKFELKPYHGHGNVSKEELIEDLKRVASKLKKEFSDTKRIYQIR